MLFDIAYNIIFYQTLPMSKTKTHIILNVHNTCFFFGHLISNVCCTNKTHNALAPAYARIFTIQWLTRAFRPPCGMQRIRAQKPPWRYCQSWVLFELHPRHHTRCSSATVAQSPGNLVQCSLEYMLGKESPNIYPEGAAI